MTLQYNITFKNARIMPARYPEILGWSTEDVAAEPDRAAELALDYVNGLLSADTRATYTEHGIDLSGRGYWGEAGNGFGGEVEELLALCEPGAILLDIDAEDGSGAQQQTIVRADGSLEQVTGAVYFPGIDFPKNLPGLLHQLRTSLTQPELRAHHSIYHQPTAAVINAARALLAGFDALDSTALTGAATGSSAAPQTETE